MLSKHAMAFLVTSVLALSGNLSAAEPDDEALQQLDFLIGEFDRRERLRNPDGSWGEWQQGEWVGSYIMDGGAVLDETHNYVTGARTANIRIYDPLSESWKVRWFRIPGYSTLVAEGGPAGDEVVFVNPENQDRWVFYDVGADSYRWRQERLIGGNYVSVYEIECERR